MALPTEPTLLQLGIGVVAVFGFAIGARAMDWRGRSGNFIRCVGLIAFGLGLGIFAGALRVASVKAPTISQTVGPTIIEGWVTSVEPGANGSRLRIKMHAISGLASDEVPKYVRVTHSLDLNVAPGRFVRCYAELRPPPARSIPGDYDFQRAAWFQQLGAVGYVQGRCRGGVLGAPKDLYTRAQLTLGAIRRQVAVFVNAAAGEGAGGFAAALVSGDRSFMSQEEQETLRRAGLAHLLAISGLHLGIVGGIIYFIARFGLALIGPLSVRVAVQKPAALITLVSITAYLLISGASVSTQRAFIMYAVFFSAILIDRPALSLRSFSIAMILVVLFAPESVFAPGFQMSFAATGVLIAIYEAWSQRMVFRQCGFGGRIIFAAKSLVVTSVAASLATAPFALYHFERLAPLGLIANLVAMPIVSLFSVPSAGLSMVLAPFGLSEIGLQFFGQSLAMITAVARWTVALGEGFEHTLNRMPDVTLLLFVVALFAGVFLRAWLRGALCAVSLGAATLSWVTLPSDQVYWAASGDVYIADGANRFRQIAFVEADALGPLRLRVNGAATDCKSGRCEFAVSPTHSLILRACDQDGAICPCAAEPNAAYSMTLTRKAKDTSGQSVCDATLHWSDIQAKGGAAIRTLSDGRVQSRHAMTCGPRPWRRNCAGSF